MEHVAVGWLVFDITDSAFLVGVTAAARMAPLFFLGIFSGAMAEWLEPWLKKCLNFPLLNKTRRSYQYDLGTVSQDNGGRKTH